MVQRSWQQIWNMNVFIHPPFDQIAPQTLKHIVCGLENVIPGWFCASCLQFLKVRRPCQDPTGSQQHFDQNRLTFNWRNYRICLLYILHMDSSLNNMGNRFMEAYQGKFITSVCITNQIKATAAQSLSFSETLRLLLQNIVVGLTLKSVLSERMMKLYILKCNF